jgi:AcrR family transcriptional regulator
MSRAKALNPDVSARIEGVATRLFILHGYNGVSYLDIAREMGVTHSSIHYYYRTKAVLAEAVLRRVADATLGAMKSIWADPSTTLFAKFVATRDWIHGQYLRSNPGGKGGKPWGLLSRFTSDAEALTLPMRRVIRASVDKLEEHIATGVAASVAHGYLAADAPQDGITLQIASLMSVTGQITRHAAGFERLDELMRWTHACLERAYGAAETVPAWPPLPDHGNAQRPESAVAAPA